MPNEGWRSLLESTTWGGCAITLHNLPFGHTEIVAAAKPASTVAVSYSRSSLYELQKSAASWDLPDFKTSTSH